MKRIALILFAALLLVSARPLPAPPALPPARIVITGDVIGTTPGGQSAPIGMYTAYGETLAEALINAEALEAQIRSQATAQAVRP